MAHPQNPNPIRPVETPRAPEPAGGGSIGPGARPDIHDLRAMVAEAIAVASRRRRVGFVVSGAIGVVLLVVLLLQTPVYEATSLLLVKFGRELVYQSEVGAENAFPARDKTAVINSELAILRSRSVLEEVVEAVGIGTLYPDLGEAVEETREEAEEEGADADLSVLLAEAAERLDGVLVAQALPDADVLRISFQHPDPAVAEATVVALVEGFLGAHLEAYAEPAMASFLEQRVSAYEERLDESERRLFVFETAHAAFALESPQATLMKWREETIQELAEVESQMGAVRIRQLEDPALAEARTTLMGLEMEADRLTGDLKTETAAQIRVVRRFIAARKAEMNEEQLALEEKAASLRDKLAQIERDLTEFPGLSAKYRRLRRERDADEEQYALYRRRLRDARLSSEMDREKLTSISIIQPASTAPKPVWPPRKGLSVPLSVMLALLAGGLAMVLVERLGGTGVAWLDEAADPQ